MLDLATSAIETAKLRGASYADARVMDIRLRDLSTKNGQVGTLAESESLGIGIRVLVRGSWGFAATDHLTREGVQACAAEAVSIAKASALAKLADVAMVPEQAFVDTWQNPYVKDPFRIPVERQLELLLAADRAMSSVKEAGTKDPGSRAASDAGSGSGGSVGGSTGEASGGSSGAAAPRAPG